MGIGIQTVQKNTIALAQNIVMPGYGQAPASGDNQEKKIRGQAASFAGMGLCCPKRTGLLQMEKAFSCKGGWCVDVSMRGDKVTVKFCCLSHSLPLSERFPKHFLRLFPARTLLWKFPGPVSEPFPEAFSRPAFEPFPETFSGPAFEPFPRISRAGIRNP